MEYLNIEEILNSDKTIQKYDWMDKLEESILKGMTPETIAIRKIVLEQMDILPINKATGNDLSSTQLLEPTRL